MKTQQKQKIPVECSGIEVELFLANVWIVSVIVSILSYCRVLHAKEMCWGNMLSRLLMNRTQSPDSCKILRDFCKVIGNLRSTNFSLSYHTLLDQGPGNRLMTKMRNDFIA